VLVVDESPLFRRRLIVGLEHDDDVEVMAEAADTTTALARARVLIPDVVFVTTQLPPSGGMAAAMALRDLVPGVAVLMIVGPDDDADLLTAVKAGVLGFAPREAVIAHGGPIARALVAGRPVLTAKVAAAVLDEGARVVSAGGRPPFDDREHDVLARLAEGRTLGQAAVDLGVATATVANRTRNVFERLHRRARSQGMAQPGDSPLFDQI
jgi:DNA-binding NarL/FixJ family response regulator